MSTIDWPAGLRPSQAQWQLTKSGAQFASPFNGALQAIDYVAERWAVSLTLPPARNAGATAALLNWLSGGVNRVRRSVYQAISRLRHALNHEVRAEPGPGPATAPVPD